ncbi:uncharacterized protein LOC143153283 isoform X2 [Ptiloglossa arizonensis]|uniref:uncharacterized protein LOC143153283 isoform X2 n=1 Tax=Ptiloglossa arizonensis TaxID=3350558 RepID=UPI003F9EC3CD
MYREYPTFAKCWSIDPFWMKCTFHEFVKWTPKWGRGEPEGWTLSAPVSFRYTYKNHGTTGYRSNPSIIEISRRRPHFGSHSRGLTEKNGFRMERIPVNGVRVKHQKTQVQRLSITR